MYTIHDFDAILVWNIFDSCSQPFGTLLCLQSRAKALADLQQMQLVQVSYLTLVFLQEFPAQIYLKQHLWSCSIRVAFLELLDFQ